MELRETSHHIIERSVCHCGVPPIAEVSAAARRSTVSTPRMGLHNPCPTSDPDSLAASVRFPASSLESSGPVLATGLAVSQSNRCG